jgi:DNA mismatch endonuclease (patch repair protein)
MADVFTAKKRSSIMSRIRSCRNQRTELRFASLLRQHHIVGWRRNAPVFGKPDFIFRDANIAVFVDGCFWHRHPRCKLAYMPKSRVTYWRRKFKANVQRDAVVTRTLKRCGWKILRVWECELNGARRCLVIAKIARALRASGSV